MEFASKTALQTALAGAIEEALREALARRGHAIFMGAGGTTPGPVYEQLSALDLDWSEVTIGLTDERWVDEDHAGSNAALFRRTLLQDKAANAPFIPMKTPHGSPFEAAPTVRDNYIAAGFADMVLLGMGPDAHTLSWFPDARGLDAALDPATPNPVAAIEAKRSDVTGDNTLRMTLTLPCIANARQVLLAITGKDKRAVFETAAPDTPVKVMAAAAGQALQVFYAD